MSFVDKTDYGYGDWKNTCDFVQRYAFACLFVKGKLSLDIGCAIGGGTNLLMKKGGARAVVGGDINLESIRLAVGHYRNRRGIHFLNLDVHQLPFRNDAFEVVVSLETIEHLANVDAYLAECRRVLKEGGPFVCSTPARKKGAKPNHDR